MAKVTLGSVFKSKGLEILTFIDKKVLVENGVVFCVLKAEKVEVTNSKFNINEQWNLTIVCPANDGNTRKFWLTFTPNETRDDFMLAIQDGLNDAHNQDMQAVHGCMLQAIPSQYDNPFYAINFTDSPCQCGLDS